MKEYAPLKQPDKVDTLKKEIRDVLYEARLREKKMAAQQTEMQSQILKLQATVARLEKELKH